MDSRSGRRFVFENGTWDLISGLRGRGCSAACLKEKPFIQQVIHRTDDAVEEQIDDSTSSHGVEMQVWQQFV
jgi:hypothetical protein